jgi:hypothetical protein
MEEGDETRVRRDPETRAWLFFWLQLFVLGAIAGFGFAFAAANGGPGDYDVGLGLAIAAILLGFLRLKLAFDGGARGLGELLLVDDMAGLFPVVPLFTVIGFAGLFLAAAWKSGSLYVMGLALFAACALAIFLNIKHAFDRTDSGTR